MSSTIQHYDSTTYPSHITHPLRLVERYKSSLNASRLLSSTYKSLAKLLSDECQNFKKIYTNFTKQIIRNKNFIYGQYEIYLTDFLQVLHSYLQTTTGYLWNLENLELKNLAWYDNIRNSSNKHFINFLKKGGKQLEQFATQFQQEQKRGSEFLSSQERHKLCVTDTLSIVTSYGGKRIQEEFELFWRQFKTKFEQCSQQLDNYEKKRIEILNESIQLFSIILVAKNISEQQKEMYHIAKDIEHWHKKNQFQLIWLMKQQHQQTSSVLLNEKKLKSNRIFSLEQHNSKKSNSIKNVKENNSICSVFDLLTKENKCSENTIFTLLQEPGSSKQIESNNYETLNTFTENDKSSDKNVEIKTLSSSFLNLSSLYLMQSDKSDIEIKTVESKEAYRYPLINETHSHGLQMHNYDNSLSKIRIEQFVSSKKFNNLPLTYVKYITDYLPLEKVSIALPEIDFLTSKFQTSYSQSNSSLLSISLTKPSSKNAMKIQHKPFPTIPSPIIQACEIREQFVFEQNGHHLQTSLTYSPITTLKSSNTHTEDTKNKPFEIIKYIHSTTDKMMNENDIKSVKLNNDISGMIDTKLSAENQQFKIDQENVEKEITIVQNKVRNAINRIERQTISA
ncbi:unnamed protein product [Didymodactylos carnosus]|uniref:Uncharacterized protein n=2 Tax=Didymodactylos carnosus TaxID=1234261 RepID=A0A814C6H8_9BILA|nr:unnamed protein product [Didymodactylos carnosus]CAF3713058.1 unnamed protein product [Didymodactylos carnosus]